jgi:hypothetical protein
MCERSPLLVRRGGCGIKKILAQPTLAPQTGWSLTSYIPRVSDHPVRSNKEASRHFLYVASTPPHEEGTTLGRENLLEKQAMTYLLHKGRANFVSFLVLSYLPGAIPFHPA